MDSAALTSIPNLVIGGGIAGLWAHARARACGLPSILIAPELGGGQTLLSQGIIHGGTKYALNGALTGASEAIKGMPERWLAALNGTGEIDLTNVQIASRHQLMINNDSLGGKVTQFFASKALRGRVDTVTPPDFLPSSAKVYQLNEPVIDTHSLIQALAQTDGIYAGHVDQLDPETGVVTLQSGVRVQAENILLAAGEGNEAILTSSQIDSPQMQRRPLQMLVGFGDLPPLWAHIVGTGSKPLATITTHNGAWYVGGGIAENGVELNETEFVKQAPASLAKLLPSVDLSSVLWESVRVNRAEPASKDKARPDHPYYSRQGRLGIAWPTKLALSPALADQALQHFTDGTQPKLDLPMPPIASTPWSQHA